MRILITGGAGFIGSATTKALHERGHEVTIIDNLAPQIHGEIPEKSYTLNIIRPISRLIRADIRDKIALDNAISNQDAILHLAAETGTGQSMYQIRHYADVNITGTADLLEAACRKGSSVKKIVVASSRAIYGEGKYSCDQHAHVYPDQRADADMAAGQFEPKCPICRATVRVVPTDEMSHVSPRSIYGVTKLAQEQLVMTGAAANGLIGIGLRYQNVYGPGQSLNNPYTGILSIFSRAMSQNRQIEIFEDGEESRDFVFIDDVAAANVLALESEGLQSAVLNVGTGQSVSVKTIAYRIRAFLNSGSSVVTSGRYRVGDIRHNVADISLAAEKLGFRARTDFETGLAHFLPWAKDQLVETPKDDAYERSLRGIEQSGFAKIDRLRGYIFKPSATALTRFMKISGRISQRHQTKQYLDADSCQEKKPFGLPEVFSNEVNLISAVMPYREIRFLALGRHADLVIERERGIKQYPDPVFS